MSSNDLNITRNFSIISIWCKCVRAMSTFVSRTPRDRSPGYLAILFRSFIKWVTRFNLLISTHSTHYAEKMK